MHSKYEIDSIQIARSNSDRKLPGLIKRNPIESTNNLVIENLCVHYGVRSVLNDISLNAKKGEVLAIIGPNGAGKSTLIKAISGVIPLSSGTIKINGQDLTCLSSQQRARQMAIVPQAVALPPAFTVWETVILGRSPYLGFLGQTSPIDEEITRQALARVDALPLAGRYVGELSGGEAQRVLLARALAQASPLLLMDEPTAHLDLKYQTSILSLTSELAHQDGLTVLIVLHDLNLSAQYADRIALIANEKLLVIGTPEQVLTAEILAPVYDIPLNILPHPFHGRPLIAVGVN